MGKDLQEFFALLCKSKKYNIILLLMSLNSASPTPAVQVVGPGSPSPWNTYDYNMHIHTVSSVSILYLLPGCSKEIQCKPRVI